MFIVNGRTHLQPSDLDQMALRMAADRTGMSVDDIARAVLAFERALDDLDEWENRK
jgi:hypothetical protein